MASQPVVAAQFVERSVVMIIVGTSFQASSGC
jgi:hypothetical protein